MHYVCKKSFQAIPVFSFASSADALPSEPKANSCLRLHVYNSMSHPIALREVEIWLSDCIWPMDEMSHSKFEEA